MALAPLPGSARRTPTVLQTAAQDGRAAAGAVKISSANLCQPLLLLWRPPRPNRPIHPRLVLLSRYVIAHIFTLCTLHHSSFFCIPIIFLPTYTRPCFPSPSIITANIASHCPTHCSSDSFADFSSHKQPIYCGNGVSFSSFVGCTIMMHQVIHLSCLDCSVCMYYILFS